MTGYQLRTIRSILGQSLNEFGRALKPSVPIHERTLRRWEGDQAHIPPQVAERAMELWLRHIGQDMSPTRCMNWRATSSL